MSVKINPLQITPETFQDADKFAALQHHLATQEATIAQLKMSVKELTDVIKEGEKENRELRRLTREAQSKLAGSAR